MKNNRKIRVAFVLPGLMAGGAERVMITLMNGIDRARFEPCLIAVDGDGPLRSLVDPTIPFYPLGRKKVSLAVPRLFAQLKKIKPDIVISSMAHMNFCCLLLRPFFPGVKFIVREAVTPSYFSENNPMQAGLITISYKSLYPLAYRVISPAQAIIDEFKSLLGMECANHVLLHNPVNIKQIRAEENMSLALRDADIVRFIAAGRLHRQKGFDRLIEAMPRFKGSCDWRLTILGEGPERSALEALIKQKGLQNKITLAGHSNNPWPQYAAADCFLMPSRHEGLPNVILESLACGTPAIATKESGGIAEIARNAKPGSVTVANNMNEFLSAMEKVSPSPSKTFRASLLPESYKIETVVQSFERILS